MVNFSHLREEIIKATYEIPQKIARVHEALGVRTLQTRYTTFGCRRPRNA